MDLGRSVCTGEGWGDADIWQHALIALLGGTQHLYLGPHRQDLMHRDLVTGPQLAVVSDAGNPLQEPQDRQQIFN